MTIKTGFHKRQGKKKRAPRNPALQVEAGGLLLGLGHTQEYLKTARNEQTVKSYCVQVEKDMPKIFLTTRYGGEVFSLSTGEAEAGTDL